MSYEALPLGFLMALAQNETALRKYEALTESAKEVLIARTHSVQSKAEMRRLVDELASLQDKNEVR